jgi:NAD-dependent deacetylase
MNMLVTQNIDGLHHAAGHNPQRILEIHGTNRLIECLTCGRQSQPAPAFQAFLNTRQCPRCECGGLLKSATISFGQSVSSELLARASQAVEDAALVLAAGSTLSVQPAASIPLAAVRQGKPYLVINQGPTDHDDMATVRIEGDVSTILPELIRKTLRLS